MAEMVGGVVETVGEEPEPESEGIPEQHEEEEEELTKVSYLYNLFAQKFDYKLPETKSFFNWNVPNTLGLVFCCNQSVLKTDQHK